MSRAWNRVNDLEELNHKLEQTIHNLYKFAGSLTSLHDKREAALVKGGSSTDRPRNSFFVEIDLQISDLANNLDHLDGLVRQLDIEVFGESDAVAPGTAYGKSLSGGAIAKGI